MTKNALDSKEKCFMSGILIFIYSSRLQNRETVRYWIAVEKQNGEQQGVQH